jgi:DUF1365 family protein
MLQILGVPARNSDMSFSVRCDKTGLEYQGSSLNGLFAQRRNLVRASFYHMLLDVLRFNRQSLELLQGEDYDLELGQYLDRNRYSREFIEHYLIPMGAAIWSAPPERFRQFPARFIVNFFNNHGLLTVRGHPQWKTVQGGAARYVEAITRPFSDRTRLNCPVVSVRRYPDRVAVAWKQGGPEDFDAVVPAAHSDQSLAMLADASPAEREVLGWSQQRLGCGPVFRQKVGIMESCLYEGYLQHRRLSPAEHVFRYTLYLVSLGLDELPAVLGGGYGLHRATFSQASFLRRDHLGDAGVPLAEAVRNLVETRTGWRSAGPVRLLTLLRNWGHYFCPLSLYYCFDGTGQTVDAVVAEVTNTPWHERHWYVLWQGNRIGEPPQLRFRHPKGFHVSPFMDVDMSYDWHLRTPGAELSVAIVNSRGDERMFDVSLAMKRRGLSRWSMLRALIRHPWMTGRVTHAIYWQAFRLWRKKCPFYPHPQHGRKSEAEQP